MKKDYFAILGLKPSASEKEIRSAYKRLAKKHHPDVNPGNKKAEEKFKEINEAYEVLSDPEKRRKWEAGDIDFESMFRDGAAGRRAGGGQGGGGFETFQFGEGADLGGIFGEIFGAMGGARGAPGAAGVRFRTGGADLQTEVTITFEEAARGTTLRIPLAHTVTCETCGGTGHLGSGRRTGRGAGPACSACDGTGVRRASETAQVRIGPGAEDGSKVRVPGKGEAGHGGGPQGDLYVILKVTPHRYFRREGRDILLDLPLSVAEATLGTRLEVPTIEGRVSLTIPAGSRSSQRLRLKGRGVLPSDGTPGGDQIVVLQIVTPKTLDPAGRQMIEEFDRLHPANPRSDVGW